MPNEKRGLKPVTPRGGIERGVAASDASDFRTHTNIHRIATGFLRAE